MALTPIEMAKFIREQVDSGDSNATIAGQHWQCGRRPKIDPLGAIAVGQI